jgi:formylmethanofuran dehydrogenase subunit B
MSSPFDEAVEQAARLLARSHAPVIAGLGTDIAGVVAAFRLAEKLGATIDHMAAETALRDQAALESIGMMLVSPGEARRRADTLLIVGDLPMEAHPELRESLLMDRPGTASADARGRQVIVLASKAPGNGAQAWLNAAPSDLPGVLAALRARVNDRPVASGIDTSDIDRCAAMMKAAKYGVAIWSPDEHDALVLEMLVGLIEDLNAKTRWAGLSVPSDPTLSGAAMASGWMAGVPLRASFARGRAEHDPWRHDARRLVESGEADAIVWISAFGEPLPEWIGSLPTVALADSRHEAKNAGDIVLAVGRPGRDHDGVLHDGRTGTLVERTADDPTNLPSVAETLTWIAAQVEPR